MTRSPYSRGSVSSRCSDLIGQMTHSRPALDQWPKAIGRAHRSVGRAKHKQGAETRTLAAAGLAMRCGPLRRGPCFQPASVHACLMPRLTEPEFISTTDPNPVQVRLDDSPPSDFREYFNSVLSEDFDGHDFSNGTGTHTWTMPATSHQHVLVKCEDANVFLVLVLDLRQRQVYGKPRARPPKALPPNLNAGFSAGVRSRTTPATPIDQRELSAPAATGSAEFARLVRSVSRGRVTVASHESEIGGLGILHPRPAYRRSGVVDLWEQRLDGLTARAERRHGSVDR
jgi:hypothetical protein